MSDPRSDPYLIAHKVRGEPAFDIAAQMVCPCCQGAGCFECDETGSWWIIPTSGHRAYPYWHRPLNPMVPMVDLTLRDHVNFTFDAAVPPGWPDHYPHSAEPNKPKIDLSPLLAKTPPKPIRRRA